MKLGFVRIFCGLAIAFLLVRLIAPVVQEWQWKWGTIHEERAAARREIEKQFSRVTIEDFTSSLPGALAAATACKDLALIKRAQKAWKSHVRRGPKGDQKEFAAKVAAEVLKAGGVNTRFEMILTRDCPASLRQAERTVAKAERQIPTAREPRLKP